MESATVGDFALPGRGPGDRGVRQRTEVCLPGRGIGRVLNRTRLIPCQATLRSALLHLLFPGGSTFVMQRMHPPLHYIMCLSPFPVAWPLTCYRADSLTTMGEPRRLKLEATKEGKVAQQFIILSALFRGVPEFRDAASWLAPDDRQELEDRQYRGRNYRKYSVRSFMTSISSITNRSHLSFFS